MFHFAGNTKPWQNDDVTRQNNRRENKPQQVIPVSETHVRTPVHTWQKSSLDLSHHNSLKLTSNQGNQTFALVKITSISLAWLN